MAGGGTTFSIEVSQYGSDLPTTEKASSSGDTLNDEGTGLSRVGSGIWSGRAVDYSSESSSSIGTPGDSEEDEESDEDNNEELGLASMRSLEDSLPSKRGLSSHYKGKSKSFGNLGDIGSVKEVPKQENPLNRKRRLQIYNKLARKSFYSWQNPKSMPLLPVHEDDNDDDDEEQGDDGDLSDEERGGVVVARRPSFKNRALKSMSCFALSDLQEEDEEEDE